MTNIPGLETQNLLLLLRTFQLWICTSITPNTSSLQALHSKPPFWSGRYLAR